MSFKPKPLLWTPELLSTRAEELYEQGANTELLELLKRAQAGGCSTPDAELLAQRACLELREIERAQSHWQRAAAVLASDDLNLSLGRAEQQLFEWQIEEAGMLFAQICRTDPEPHTYLRLGLCHDLLEQPELAEECLEAAKKLAPQTLGGLRHVRLAEFEIHLQSAYEKLGQPLAKELESWAVLLEPVPSRGLARGRERDTPPDALGLCVGASALERPQEGFAGGPGVIYVFQRNLERTCLSETELAEEIAITLYHELGHALGFDERGVEELGLG